MLDSYNFVEIWISVCYYPVANSFKPKMRPKFSIGKAKFCRSDTIIKSKYKENIHRSSIGNISPFMNNIYKTGEGKF